MFPHAMADEDDVYLEHPNRDKASSKASRATIVLLLLVSALLLILVAVGGWDFLQGAKGNAWVMPSQHGQFVLVVHQDKNLCALYAKTVPAATAQAMFEKVVGKAPEPFRSERKRNTSDKGPDGVKSTIAYEWSTEKSPRKPLFALTTTTSKSSVAQGVATAAIGH